MMEARFSLYFLFQLPEDAERRNVQRKTQAHTNYLKKKKTGATGK